MNSYSEYIVGITLAWNDADVIETALRHNSRFLDLNIVALNPTQDGTTEIVRAMAAEGLPIVPWELPRLHQDEACVISSLIVRVQDFLNNPAIMVFRAEDILIAPDVAEFRSEVLTLPTATVGRLPLKIGIPSKEDTSSAKTAFFGFTDVVQADENLEPYIKPKGTATHPLTPVRNNNFELIGTDEKPLPSHRINSAHIARIPVRSTDQIVSRAFMMWALEATTVEVQQPSPRQTLYFEIAGNCFEGNASDLRELAISFSKSDHQIASDVGIIPETSSNELEFEKAIYSELSRPASCLAGLPSRIGQYRHAKLGTTHLLEIEGKTSSSTEEDTTNGTFSPSKHLKQLMCDWPTLDYVCTVSGANSVQDIGCGLGAYLRLIKSTHGCRVNGVDGSQWSELHFVRQEDYDAIDLSDAPPALAQGYDLVVCLEVVEHLPESSAVQLVKQLAKSDAQMVLFSAAQPNQGGSGHICYKEANEWLEIFYEAGWQVDFNVTIAARLLSSLHWFRKNIFCLKRNTDAGPSANLDHLLRISKQSKPWPSLPSKTVIDNPGEVETYRVDENTVARDKLDSGMMDGLLSPVSPLGTSDIQAERISKLQGENTRQRFVLSRLEARVKTLEKDLEHAQRYPWKLLSSAIKQRL